MISCEACGERFESEEQDWRAFINEAKGEGWKIVKDNNEWLRFCSQDCKEGYYE